MRFVILASGRGTNAAALMDFAKAHAELVQVVGLLSDRAEAQALEEARKRGVETFIVPPRDDGPLLSVLERLQPEWACLAGYRKLVSARFLSFFMDKAKGHARVLNVHPSLLPAFPGLKAYEQAFAAGVKVSGVTVHLVDSGLDTGPVVLQEALERLESDNIASFEARGLKIEHRLFCLALELVARDKLECNGKSRWVKIHE